MNKEIFSRASIYTKAFLGVWAAVGALFLATEPMPFLGNFATKEIVYAMIAKNFLLDPARLLFPTLDMLRFGQPSYHLLEWPWPAYLTGLLDAGLPGDIEFWGRLPNILLWAVYYYLIYRWMCEMRFDAPRASRIAFCASASPLFFIYFQSFQMEAAAMVSLAAGYLFLNRYLFVARSRASLAAFTAVFTLTFLVKPHWGLYFLPAFWLIKEAAGSWRRGIARSAALLAVPALFFSAWVGFNFLFSEKKDPVFFNLAMSIKAHPDPQAWFMDGEFYARIAQQGVLYILGPLGAVMLLAGFPWKRKGAPPAAARFFAVFALASAVYFVALPRKFHTANYYFLTFMPLLGYAMATGLERIEALLSRRFAASAVQAVLALTMLFSAWGIAWRPLYVIPEPERFVEKAGIAAEKHLPENARVIAASGSSPTLLYYTGRRGWGLSLDEKDLQRAVDRWKGFREQGADYFLTTDKALFSVSPYREFLRREGELVEETPEYILYRLRR
jgi:hypothetical protein